MPILYVDSNLGDDDNQGDDSGHPTRSISAALYKNFDPTVFDPATVLLADATGQPPYAEESTGFLDLRYRERAGGGEITIQPASWNDDYYNSGNDPFTNEEYDLTAPRGVTIPSVVVGDGYNFTVKGVAFDGVGNGVPGIAATPGSAAVVRHCQFSNFDPMGCSVQGGRARVENCYFEGNRIAVCAHEGSVIDFYGNNMLVNSYTCGLLIAVHSVVSVYPWDCDQERATLVVETTQPRDNYRAIWMEDHSSLILSSPDIAGFPMTPGFVLVLRDDDYDPDDYLGVSINSMSLLMGARNVSFTDDKDEGFDTVAAGRQIVVASDEGAYAID